MSDIDWSQFDPATRAVRAGQRRTNEGEHSEPIFTTSSYVFGSAAEAAARFSGEQPGNIYSRFTNPTVSTFEQRLAALEGGNRCVATASGMSAILATCMAVLKAGDHIVASRSIFGTTSVLFTNIIAKFGIETTFVKLSDLDDWRAALRPNTRLLFLETPSNPLNEVADIALLAQLAREQGAVLAVDNVFCTPILQQPLSLGADMVIHSATKYIDGQGRCIGGAVIGNDESVSEGVYGILRTAGPSLSPFNAWVFLKGLETLPWRMRGHCENAQRIAEWLEGRPGVSRVWFTGLPSHPQHELASRQQSGYGAVMAFELVGGKDAAWRFIDATQIFSITANLGDARSTITHPASTTHGRLSPEDRLAAGITDGVMRIAVGLESSDDLIADLERGLHAARSN